MQKTGKNIIKFKTEKQDWKDVDGDIMRFKSKIIFKNCELVDINENSSRIVDILVENGIVKKIGKHIYGDSQTEEIDIDKNFVLPSFKNAFAYSSKVHEIDLSFDNKTQMLFSELMVLKDVLGGVLFADGSKNTLLVDDIAELEEKDLSEISNLSASKNLQVILKVGQNLDELGTVDKKFGKSLPLVLEDFGILDRDWVLVGGNCLEKDDLRIFREHGNKIVICPLEDGQAGRRPVNLLTLKNLDFDIEIGSGYAFEIDYFAYIRQILMQQWALFEDKNCISEKDVFLMATGEPTVKEGDRATFIVVNKERSLYPTILQSLVWGKSKQDVIMTVLEGRIIQTFGDIVSGISGLDYFEIIDELVKNMKKEK